MANTDSTKGRPSDASAQVHTDLVSPAVLATSQPLNGCTQLQLELLLQDIATSANALDEFALSCNSAQRLPPNAFFIVATLAQRIGALADHALAGDVVGSPIDWMVGDNFSRPTGRAA